MTPNKEWLHMDTVELEKLHWTQDLPPLRRQQTQERMQARFSLQGELLEPDVDLPTHLGLHHHGEEAERAGYSLQELFHLTRSQVSQQRALALHVLSQIVGRAQAGWTASLQQLPGLFVLCWLLLEMRSSLTAPSLGITELQCSP